jgi:protein phosphatase
VPEGTSGQHTFLVDRGRRRVNNQDTAYTTDLSDGWVLLIVADGVGGAAGGDVASRETVKAIQAYFASAVVTEPEADMQAALRQANARLRELRLNDPRLANMATTLVLALVREREFWIVSLGDSRAYVLDGDKFEQVTEDDSLVAEQVRAGLLTEEEAANAPMQNVITRGIGVEEDIEAEPIAHFTLNPGAVLLLCSDGLFRPLTDEEIADTLRTGNVREVARELIRRANDKGGPDNIGVALYREIIETPTE